MKENLYTSLKELGLTELEINLYTISLLLGPSPISSLAGHIKMSRPNVYKIIRGLEKHGLAKYSDQKRYSRHFIVESPTVVLEKLREKKEMISKLDNEIVFALPELLSMYHQGEGPTKVKIIQDRENYLKYYNGILDEAKDEILFFGAANEFINFIGWETEKNWIKKRVKKEIFIKILIFSDELASEFKKSDKDEMRETRTLKNLAPFSTSFQLWANKIMIWQPKTPLAVLIEDEYITNMLKSVFDHLWKKSS